MDPFISHVQLRIADLERSLGFYRDLLGFRIVGDDGMSVTLGVPPVDGDARGGSSDAPPMLTLREQRGLRPRPRHPRTAGLYHVAWLVPSRPDLGRALAGLGAARYPLTGASDHAVSESLYLDDPDGNGVEIYADKPRATWQWTDGRVHMTVDPLDLPGLLKSGESGESGESRESRESGESRASSGVLAAGTHIGHVHFVVPDLQAAKNHFINDVGLDVTLEWPMLIGLSHGGYHHHVNLNNWAGDGAPPDDPNVAGLDAVTMGGKVIAGRT